MKRIPIKTAEEIAKKYGYDQVIIYARKTNTDKGSCILNDGGEHMTTYGINSKHCEVAAQIGDYLKYKIMGWVKDK